jgi:hypothetical protein
MNFDFTPTRMAMFGQTINMSFVILLSGIEVRVHQGMAIGITPPIYDLRVLSAPALESSLLFVIRCTSVSVLWNNRRFEVIRYRKN